MDIYISLCTDFDIENVTKAWLINKINILCRHDTHC